MQGDGIAWMREHQRSGLPKFDVVIFDLPDAVKANRHCIVLYCIQTRNVLYTNRQRIVYKTHALSLTSP